MSEFPKILKCTTVAESRLFRIEALDLEFANGSRRQFERLAASTHGAVAIVAMPDAETVLLIREYAAGTGNYELGLPKGLIENNEDILEAANRELMEETGFGARSLELLNTLTVSHVGVLPGVGISVSMQRKQGVRPGRIAHAMP